MAGAFSRATHAVSGLAKAITGASKSGTPIRHTRGVVVSSNIGQTVLTLDGGSTQMEAFNYGHAASLPADTVVDALIVGNQAYILGAYGTAAQPIPTGVVLPFDGTTAPAGFVLAVGGTLLRATYPALHQFYADQSYPYGPGDGSTTFGIPDGRGKTLVAMLASSGNFATHGNSVGEETHTLSDSEMPVHSHGGSTAAASATHHHQSGILTGTSGSTGVLASTTASNNGQWNTGNDSGTSHSHGINNDGSGTAHNNVQPSLVIGGYIIKT